MEIVIVTGMSGSGKTRASMILEDAGYYCISNLPSTMLLQFVNIYSSAERHSEKVAFIIDVRSEENFPRLSDETDRLRVQGYSVKLIFLDCDIRVLVNRYKETRRIHPLVTVRNLTTVEALELEKSLLAPLREKADYVIDTSTLTVPQLKDNLIALLSSARVDSIVVTCLSFGYKYGIPAEADLIYDVRCFPNPFYIPELKNLTGLDEGVRSYVFSSEPPRQFLNKLTDMIDFLIPLYIKEGKSQLTVAVGCTGGKHRSVAMTEALANHLRDYGMNVITVHRDIEKKFNGDR